MKGVGDSNEKGHFWKMFAWSSFHGIFLILKGEQVRLSSAGLIDDVDGQEGWEWGVTKEIREFNLRRAKVG